MGDGHVAGRARGEATVMIVIMGGSRAGVRRRGLATLTMRLCVPSDLLITTS